MEKNILFFCRLRISRDFSDSQASVESLSMGTLSPNRSLNSGTGRDAGVEVVCINSSFRGIHR